MPPQLEQIGNALANEISGRFVDYAYEHGRRYSEHYLNRWRNIFRDIIAHKFPSKTGLGNGDTSQTSPGLPGYDDDPSPHHEDEIDYPFRTSYKRSAVKQAGVLLSSGKVTNSFNRLKKRNFKSTLEDQLKYLDRNFHIESQSSLTVDVGPEESIIVPFVFRDNLYISTADTEDSGIAPYGNLYNWGNIDDNQSNITDAMACRFLTSNVNVVINNKKQVATNPWTGAPAPWTKPLWADGCVRVPVGYYQPWNISDLMNFSVAKTDPRLLNSWAFNPTNAGMNPNYIALAQETANSSLGKKNGWINYKPRQNSAPYLCTELLTQNLDGIPAGGYADPHMYLRGASDTTFRCCEGSAEFNIVNTNAFPVVIDIFVCRTKKGATKACTGWPLVELDVASETNISGYGVQEDSPGTYSNSLPHIQPLAAMAANSRKKMAESQWSYQWPSSTESKGVDWMASFMQPSVTANKANNFQNNMLYSPNFAPFPNWSSAGVGGSAGKSFNPLTGATDTTTTGAVEGGQTYIANRYEKLEKKSYKLPAGSRLRYSVKLGEMELDCYKWCYEQCRSNAPTYEQVDQTTPNYTPAYSQSCDEPGETTVVYFKVSGGKVLGQRVTVDLGSHEFQNAEMTAVASKVLITTTYREDIKTLYKKDTPGRVFASGDWKKPKLAGTDIVIPAVPIPITKAIWSTHTGTVTADPV